MRVVTSLRNFFSCDGLVLEEGMPIGEVKSCPWTALFSRRFVRLKEWQKVPDAADADEVLSTNQATLVMCRGKTLE